MYIIYYFLLIFILIQLISCEEVSSSSSSSTKKKKKSKKSAKVVEPKKKKSTKDWSKVKIDDVEKEWKKGDSEDELEDEFERQQKMSQKMKGGLNFNNPDEMKKALSDPLGHIDISAKPGAMAFIDLKPKPNGGSYVKKEVDELAALWSGLIKSNNMQANLYNIGDEAKPKMIISVNQGWALRDAIKFILTRKEVALVTLDNKEYKPLDEKDDDDDDGPL